MKFRALAAALVLCMLLSGCSGLLDREYIWMEKYDLPQAPESGQQVSAANYSQLYNALADIVEKGKTQDTISVADYPSDKLEADMLIAAEAVQRTNPIAAYAVETITGEVGTSAGEPVLAVQVTYLHDRTEILKVKTVADCTEAEAAVFKALVECQSGIVLQIQDYTAADFGHIVEAYALTHPETVMELPQVTEIIYPESGQTRVVELKFTYQTSRDSLKAMQNQVAPVFSSAVLYVSGDGSASEKYGQLYSFLMERYEYTYETSITPAYSLLRHGVGDSKAFAMVYGAMCRQAGLECLLVSGTWNGQSRYWNIICHDGVYYHVDLLRCSEDGEFAVRSNSEMLGYVWDYSAYPACGPQ